MRIEVADGVALHVRRWGNRRPDLLLIHGFGQGGFVWRSLAASMVSCGLAAVDLRGHGDSDHDRMRRYDLETHVDDFTEVVRALDLDEFVLVGHSLGASVALLAAAKLPRPPRAVALIDGGPGLSPAASAHIREEFLQTKFRYRSITEHQEQLQASMPLAAAQVLQELAVDALERLGPEEFRLKADRSMGYQAPGPSLDAELWHALHKLQCPLLLVRGAASALCSKRWCEAFSARVPHAVVEVVERAGHAVMLDNPIRFNALVHQYVSLWLDRRGALWPHSTRVG